ncbi:MAG: hypothetical protein EXQ70_11810 [Solirubrobacterales bacterium]|nr:hypothetical protein [Solirubrobacterales bacterium]
MRAAPPAKEIAPLLEAGLQARQLAQLSGRSLRSAERWVGGETAPKGEARERLVATASVLEEFARTFPGADGVRWLEGPDVDLDFSSPAELIAAGDAKKVLALLLAVGEGVYL